MCLFVPRAFVFIFLLQLNNKYIASYANNMLTPPADEKQILKTGFTEQLWVPTNLSGVIVKPYWLKKRLIPASSDLLHYVGRRVLSRHVQLFGTHPAEWIIAGVNTELYHWGKNGWSMRAMRLATRDLGETHECIMVVRITK
eukprot:3623556-Pyramimonas_sp.AAC.1